MIPTGNFASVALGVLALLLLAAPDHATAQATNYWDPARTGGTNGSGNGSWSTTAATNTSNWWNGTSNIVWTTAAYSANAYASFGGSGSGTVTMATTINAYGLVFQTNGYLLTGNVQLSLGGGGISIPLGVTATMSNINRTYLQQSQTWSNADFLILKSAGMNMTGITLTISNSSNTATAIIPTLNGSSGNNAYTNTVAGSGNVNVTNMGACASFANPIACPTANSTPTMIYAGSGTFSLVGANNNFAATNTNSVAVFQLSSGTLALGNNNSLGALSGVGATQNTYLRLSGGTLLSTNGARTLANGIQLSNNSTIGGSNAFTFSGAVTNSGGNWALTNNNTGGVTISGAVSLSESSTSRTMTIAGSGSTTISGNIVNGSNSTTSGLTKTGSGTLTLSGSNSYGGSTTVNGGTLLINGTNSGSGTITVTSGGTLSGVGSAASSVSVASNSTLAPGNSSGSGTLTINTFGMQDGSSTLTIRIGGASSTAVSASSDSTLNGTLNFVTNAALTAESYILLTNSGGSFTGTFSSVSNLPSGYAVTYGSNSVQLSVAVSDAWLVTNGTITSYNGTLSGIVVIPGTINSNAVTAIADNAFTNQTSAVSISIPSGVTSIGAGAFSGCTGLTSVTIPDSVTSIGDGAFSGCTSLASISASATVMNYLAANAARLGFTQQSQTISFPSLGTASLGAGGTVPLTATAPSGLAVTYSTDSTNVVIIGTNVTLLGTGTATIVATQSGAWNWLAATPVTNTLVVTAPPALFVKLSGTQGDTTTPTSAATTNIAAPGSGWNYSAAAPVDGTTWNVINQPNPSIPSGSLNGGANGTFPCNTASNIALTSATGDATSASLTVSVNIADIDTGYGTRVEPTSLTGSADPVLGPSALMGTGWRIYRGGNSTTHRFTGLPPGGNYLVYVYSGAITGTNAYGSSWSISASNYAPVASATSYDIRGTTNGTVFSSNSGVISPVSGASGSNTATTWGSFWAVADTNGVLQISTAKNGLSHQFFQGYQLMPYPAPSISAQPTETAYATTNGSLTLNVTASGTGSLTYQWLKNGVALTNGASGTGSTITGATSASLSISGITSADAASYRVMVSNPGGAVLSSASTLTISATPIAPIIATQPTSVSAVTGGSASFIVAANGSTPMGYQWLFSTDGVNYTNIAGKTNQTLSLTSVGVTNAGYYQALVTNAAGSTTSAAATLLIAPVVQTNPSTSVFEGGSTNSISVVATGGAGSPSPLSYRWTRNGVAVTNGGAVSGATTGTLTFSGITADQSGYYSVTVSNSAGYVTTPLAYVGVPSTQSVTLAPVNGSTNIAPDQQFRIAFPSAPKIGNAGKFTIRDAADNSVAAQIDASQFVTIAPGNSSSTIPNAMIRRAQGNNSTTTYYYMPVAVYGNEAWFTVTNRLAYGHSFYITVDQGLLLDSSNAAYPGITNSNSWTFTTKNAAPSGVTNITVGQDGSGDFATFQGAFDWIPSNNTTPMTVSVLPGIYRDNATISGGRDFVTITGTGDRRTDAQLIYPYPFNTTPFTYGTLRVESSDVTVRNLTIDCMAYSSYTPTGWSYSGGFNPFGATNSGNNGFAGAHNTLATTGKRITFDNTLIKGGQDTYYADATDGSAYFYNSEIWGSVDYIYGSSTMIFSECDIVQIRSTGGPITAPNTPYAVPYGVVFLNCRFPLAKVSNGYPYDVATGSSTFQRPWGQDGMTAVVNCQLGSQFTTAGWATWGGRENTCRDVEIGSTSLDGGTIPSIAERQAAGAYWLNTVDPDYTSPSMSPTNALLAPPTGILNRVAVTNPASYYSTNSIFTNAAYGTNLSSWVPPVQTNLPLLIIDQPVAQSVTNGSSVTMSVFASGSALITYQWYQNGSPIAGASSPTYIMSNVRASNGGSYYCAISNSVGSTNSATVTLTVTPTPAAVTISGTNAAYNGTGRSVTVSTVPTNLSVGVTYDGSTNLPVNAGSYAVVASVTDSNYAGSNTAVLTIAKATALLTFSGTSQPYNGTQRSVTVATVPGSLSNTVTYDGSPTAPSAVGSYPLSASVVDSNYEGSNTGTLVIYDAAAQWRSNAYGTTNNTGSAADSSIGASGLVNLKAYALGIDPNSPSTNLPLAFTASGTNFTVSFTAKDAGTDPGYGGLTRYYTLEGTTNLVDSNSWSAIGGYSNIPATNQTVIYSTNTTGAAKWFYRLRVWLQ